MLRNSLAGIVGVFGVVALAIRKSSRKPGKISYLNTHQSTGKTLVQFGWTAATEKEVVKKRKLLESEFDHVVTVTTPILTTLFGKDAFSDTIAQVGKELKKLPSDQKIVFQFYSGGGALYYPFSKFVGRDLSGIILDSTPVPADSFNFIKLIQRRVPTPLNFLISIMTYIPMELYFYFWGMRIEQYQVDMKSDIYYDRFPILILVGTDDSLVPCDEVEDMVEDTKAVLELFEGSDHLNCDTDQPEQYLGAIQSFLGNL